MAEFQYQKLANEVEFKIRNGVYSVGDKLPSLRIMHEKTGLSITTVNQSYMELEDRGLIETKEKSGFYVKPPLEGVLYQEQIRESENPSVSQLIFSRILSMTLQRELSLFLLEQPCQQQSCCL